MIAWQECWLSTPVSCDHETVQFDCWSIKIFSFGGFSDLIFIFLGFFSYGALVHFGFSLCAHVIAWRECWLPTPVVIVITWPEMGLYVLIVGSTKILPLLGILSALSFILLGAFVLWCFSTLGTFLLCRSRDRMTRMLIVHTCCDRDHMTRNGIVHLDNWSTKIFSSFGGFVCFEFYYPLGFLSYGALVH